MFNPYSIQGGTATLDPQVVGMNGQSRIPELFGGAIGNTIPVGGMTVNPALIPGQIPGYGCAIPQTGFVNNPYVQTIPQAWPTYGYNGVTNPVTNFIPGAQQTIHPLAAFAQAMVPPAALYQPGYPSTIFGIPTFQPALGFNPAFGVSPIQSFVPAFHPFNTLPTAFTNPFLAQGAVQQSFVNPFTNGFANPLVNPVVNPYVNTYTGGAAIASTFPFARAFNPVVQNAFGIPSSFGLPSATPFATPFQAALTSTPFVDPTTGLCNPVAGLTQPFVNPLSTGSIAQHPLAQSWVNPYTNHPFVNPINTLGLNGYQNVLDPRTLAILGQQAWTQSLIHPIARLASGLNPVNSIWQNPALSGFQTNPYAISQLASQACYGPSCSWPTSFGYNPYSAVTPYSNLYSGYNPFVTQPIQTVNPYVGANYGSLNHPLFNAASICSTVHPSAWSAYSALQNQAWCSPACLN